MSKGRHTSFRGGDFRGAHFGDEHGTHNVYHFPAAQADLLTDLREALDDDRVARIVALGRTGDDRAALAHELAATRRALAVDEPDGAAVRTRWSAVLAVLGTALAMNADVAQITQFVLELFN